MAPGARLHLILFEDEVDFENALDYVRDHGIRIANLSVNWFGSSYYDDTGPINDADQRLARRRRRVLGGRRRQLGLPPLARRLARRGRRRLALVRARNDEQLGLTPEIDRQSLRDAELEPVRGYSDPPTDLDLFIYSAAGGRSGVEPDRGRRRHGDRSRRRASRRVAGQTVLRARAAASAGPTAGLDLTIDQRRTSTIELAEPRRRLEHGRSRRRARRVRGRRDQLQSAGTSARAADRAASRAWGPRPTAATSPTSSRPIAPTASRTAGAARAPRSRRRSSRARRR